MGSVVRQTKRVLYGVLPYLSEKVFSPHSPKLPYYAYLAKNGYTHYPYPFAEKYLQVPIAVLFDPERGLHYVMHRGAKRLYYPRSFTCAQIDKNYRSLLIEQDALHAHHYVDSLQEFAGRVVLDVGAAEGVMSLDAIDTASEICLFECNSDWVEALEATFAPWAERVRIVPRMVGAATDDRCIALDDFLSDRPHEPIFLKLDVEGAELSVLAGSERLFTAGYDLDFAICTYHRRNDERLIAAFLERYGCDFFVRPGRFYVRHRLRPALIRGCKK